MKNVIRIGFSLFTILVCTPSVHATDYNYLPPDVGIKQNEAISALEYRLQSLEAQIANNPAVSVDTIDARITALEGERDTEKQYITGLYGSYGIGNQLEAKLSEIDAKYTTQISNLENQKNEYASQVSAQAKAEKEAEQLRQQIIALQKQNLDLVNKQTDSYVTTEVFTGTDIYDGFVYMDSLPLEEASAFYQRVNTARPDVAKRITALYNVKYPHGKAGTAINDEYLASLPKASAPVLPAPTPKVTPLPKAVESEPVMQTEATTTPVPTPTIQAPIPVIETPPAPTPIQETFVDKVVGFFKRLVSWW